MADKNWLAEIIHYVVLALAVWFAFGWLMTSNYEFSDYVLFIILLLVIIIVDMILHKILEKWGYE